MTVDLVRALGYMTLGSRLKRLGERLQADVAEASGRQGLHVAAGLYPVFAALDRDGELTIKALAEAIGVSQPAATKLAARLLEKGFIAVEPHDGDQRSKSLVLTGEGARVLGAARGTLWPRVERAVKDLFDPVDGSFIAKLEAVEDSLDRRSLLQRLIDLEAVEAGNDRT